MHGWAFLSFGVGVAVGFQSAYKKYEKSGPSIFRSLPGLFYLLTRGLVPAGVFVALQGTEYAVPGPLWVQALVVGAAAELVLRSRIYLTQAKNSSDEIYVAPFDLLKWYQGLLLDYAAHGVDQAKIDIIKKYLPKEPFEEVCRRIRNNLGAVGDKATADLIEAKITTLLTEFRASPKPDEDYFSRALAFLILDKLGKAGLRTLLTPP